MDVVYSDELKAYMARRGFKDIKIETYCSHTCSGQPNLVVRPIDGRESAELRARGANCLHGEVGDVFLGVDRIPEGGGLLRLGLKNFLGAKEITAEGIVPLRLF